MEQEGLKGARGLQVAGVPPLQLTVASLAGSQPRRHMASSARGPPANCLHGVASVATKPKMNRQHSVHGTCRMDGWCGTTCAPNSCTEAGAGHFVLAMEPANVLSSSLNVAFTSSSQARHRRPPTIAGSSIVPGTGWPHNSA